MSVGRVCVIRPGAGKGAELPSSPLRQGEQQPPGLPFLGQQPLLTLSAWHSHWFLRASHLAPGSGPAFPHVRLPELASESQGPTREHSETSSDINHISVFLGQSPKAIEISSKNKCLIKLICFCTAKETENKQKKQAPEWEEIFANDATDRGLISR